MPDFEVFRDVMTGGHVAFPRSLEVDILDGVQVYPPKTQFPSANKLLVFTGTAILDLRADTGDESRVVRGVVRVRLRRPLADGELLVGSATMAALASIHTDDEVLTAAIDDVETILGDDDDLWLVAHAAVQGETIHLGRMAYQANVLVLHPGVQLQSFLVKGRRDTEFSSLGSASEGDNWTGKVTLTAPADRGYDVALTSSDPVVLPVPPIVTIPFGAKDASFVAPNIPAIVGNAAFVDVPVTASSDGRDLTATVRIRRLPR